MRGELKQSARYFLGNLVIRTKRGILFLTQGAAQWLKIVTGRRRVGVLPFRDLLSLTAILAGGVACGLWLDSIAAGLLAFIALVLLSRIARSLERIVACLKPQAAAAVLPERRSSDVARASARKVYVSTKAMERLRPWVEDESTLTEESAKAYCSVLLDTLAILEPRLAGRAPAEDTWS